MSSTRDPEPRGRLPSLGFALASAFHPALSLEEDRAGAALARQAVERGARYVDCGAGSRTAEVERRWSATWSSLPPPTVLVSSTLVGEPSGTMSPLAPGIAPELPGAGPVFGLRPDRWADDLAAALDRSLRRLRSPRLAVGWMDGLEARALAEPELRRRLKSMVSEGTILEGWGLRYDRGLPALDELSRSLVAEPSHLALPFHLLNAPAALRLAEEARRAGVAVVALDPFAGGLLDGSRLQGGLATGPGESPHPVQWTRLRAELRPVTSLGYLTQDRRRTLAQASLQYLWGAPGVVAALLPLRRPSDIDVGLAALHAHPLSSPEREAVARGDGSPREIDPRG